MNESVQYHSDNVDEVKSKLQDIERQVEKINLDEITEDFVSKITKKRADLEDWSPRNNLCFEGFQEEAT